MKTQKKRFIYLTTISSILLWLVIFNTAKKSTLNSLQNETIFNEKSAKKLTEHNLPKQESQTESPIPHLIEPNSYLRKTPVMQAISLRESNASHSILSFDLPNFSVKKIATPSGRIYAQIISKRGAKNLNKKGYPALPRYKQQLLVPKNCSIDLITTNLQFTSHTINTLLPGSGPITRTEERPEVECGDFYDSKESYPSSPIFISSSFEFRNMRAITITINPFIFNAETQKLNIYKRLDFEIKTPGGKLLLENPPVIADFQTRASNEFINYTQATEEYTSVTTRALPDPELGNILVVYASQFKNSLADFVFWKKKIGFNVETAEYPADTGAGVQSLKNFIDQRPTVSHIILIGDAQDIPARVYNWEFTNFTDSYGNDNTFSSPTTRTHYTDRYYAGVDPGINHETSDLVADKFISRISSSNIITVEKQLSRIIDYESGTYLSTDSLWLENVLLVASKDGKYSSPFNKADYEHFNEIATNLIPNSHYTNASKLYDEDGDVNTPLATKAAVVEQLELGQGLTYYLGHGYAYKWVTSSFDSTAAQSLVTNHKPSLIIEPVCNNGLFYSNTQCLAEYQMENEGAIGILASPSETFWNPPILLLKSITDLVIGDQFQTVGGVLSSGIDDAVLWSTNNESSYEDKATAIQMLYFGDCSMAIRTMAPKPLTMTAPQSISSTAQSFQVTATPESKINLLNGNTIIDSTTVDLNGNATLSVNSSDFESYTIVAWKRNSLAKSTVISRDLTMLINLSPSNDNLDPLINLSALLNGTIELEDNSKFTITDGKLYYKVDAIRGTEESVILNWTATTSNTKQVTLTITIQEKPESNYSISLKSGWNLVGSPIDSNNPLATTTVGTRNIPSVDLLFYNWNQTMGTYYRPIENERLHGQHAFWIYSPSESTTQSFSGSSQKGLMTELTLGWNLYSPTEEIPTPLGALSVWKWNVLTKNYTQLSTTENLIPLTGYWVFMNQ